MDHDRNPQSVHRTILTALIGASLIATVAMAAGPTPYDQINAAAAADKISVTKLRPHIDMLEGSGGNICVLSGRAGLLLVDAGIAVSQRKIESALDGIEHAPLRYVIDTHWHWDHTNGNPWVHKAGATVIAHANTARHLGQTLRVEEWGHTFTPLPVAARPTIIVGAEKTMSFDGESIRMRHYAPAHTDGDLSVFFVKNDVLCTGDTWWNGQYPFIDYVAGGSIDGMIRAANANIAMTTGRTAIVPGHGPAGNRAQLIAYRAMLVAVRARVAALKAAGKSIDQVVAARPTAAYDATWGKSVIDGALFTRLVYRGV